MFSLPVCLSVCVSVRLSVGRIAQRLLNRFPWSFDEGWGMPVVRSQQNYKRADSVFLFFFFFLLSSTWRDRALALAEGCSLRAPFSWDIQAAHQKCHSSFKSCHINHLARARHCLVFLGPGKNELNHYRCWLDFEVLSPCCFSTVSLLFKQVK